MTHAITVGVALHKYVDNNGGEYTHIYYDKWAWLPYAYRQ